VHERSIDSDFLLIILKELLARRPDLKLILMSATLNSGLFANYFDAFKVTLVDIPGRTFPVTRLFLEDVVEISGYECRVGSEFARKASKGGKGGGDKGGEKKGGSALTEKLGVSTEQWMDRIGVEGVQQALGKKYSKRTADSLHKMSHSMINTEMLVALLCHIARQLEIVEANKSTDDKSKQGAVLVFLPGLAEITDLIKAMQDNPLLGQTSKYLLYPLHSALSTSDQRMVFLTPPVGVTKIVVSTNIAEVRTLT
jgi:HrpA-like RNA helicase